MPNTDESRILVSIATYQERENLSRLVHSIHEQLPNAHVLIIDDNSPDGTGRMADELAERDQRVHVIHREGKLGLGSAMVRGMQYAIENEYELAITMDADFSHDPCYLPDVVAGMDRHDVMIGSRYIPGGGTKYWPLSRKFMSRGVNILVRLLLRFPTKDNSGGFRCYRVSLLKSLDFDRLLSRGYSFQEEMLYHCLRSGARLGETPIIFVDRRAGTSKVSYLEIGRSLMTLLWLGVNATLGTSDVPNTRFDDALPR